MNYIINGIQQIGIGVTNAKEVFNWYRTYLGFDILVFNDVARASLMTQYTNQKEEERHALLAMNLQGGGGLEIWQFTNRLPAAASQNIRLGDLGINVMKLRTSDIKTTHERLSKLGTLQVSDIFDNTHFFFQDPWANWVQIVENDYIFTNTKSTSSGVLGAIIGVSDIVRSSNFFQNLLGYDIVIDKPADMYFDVPLLAGNHTYKRMLLRHNKREAGGFSELYGPSEIELIQVLEREPNRIFENRLWGDLGYIHLCFDVYGMDDMKQKAKNCNQNFTVDSSESFDMGEAAGRFAYVEDPDGTLIELVETHKVPISKKLGIHIDLKKRNPQKPIPAWLVKTMRIHRKTKNI
ncbi:catechol 2,3-dioxygenase-like lactoylglutathione lyase family enzyme [Flavobacteriaceae bacterium MAR_2009_75]|nr:catechol 2,3-dioxygenase-like lactoylglutathione lyase family enzyme [Flavobacteriaceae bacterium MAR_2009_75]